jgi:uncharacterized surface protein with fasciclin (FAS1) repeats
MKRITIFLFACISILSFNACKEDIDESNLYTFTGETIEDYLVNRNDRFSNFNYILTRIGYDNILSAYGTYTCFAPDNEAIMEYVDSLYNDMSNKDNPRNGMIKPGLEGLTDSLCRDIALFHLLSTEWRSIDMNGEKTIPTLLGRDINTALDSVSATVALNREALILTDAMDVDLENGILHEISHVITRSNRLVSGELAELPGMTIFTEALVQTGLADTLTNQVRKDFDTRADAEEHYVPEECKMGYTIFAETDEAFRAKGINSFDDLVAYANEAYGRCAVTKNSDTHEGWYDYFRNHHIQVSTGSDYKNPYNALSMFMRYHIVQCKVAYDKLVYHHDSKLSGSDNTNGRATRVEYYETMLPYTLLKVSEKSSKRYINRWVTNSSLTNAIEKLGTEFPNPISTVKFEGIEIQRTNKQALNGYIHPINDVLVYDWNVPNGALNERMRFDYAALFGEMMSNGFRHVDGNVIKSWNGGKSGKLGDEIRIPDGFFENLKQYSPETTKLTYGPMQTSSWYNYQKDEFRCRGTFDFAMRLPPVPDGTYELRIGYTAEQKRGMLQFYLGTSSSLSDMRALDIPLDMRIMPGSYPLQQDLTEDNPCPYTGQVTPDKTGDKGVASDANMRNLGYMRGPLAYSGESGWARYATKDLRRILVRDGFQQGEYWLRFKSVLNSEESEFHMDYIEFCPSSVYNNATYAEDMF